MTSVDGIGEDRKCDGNGDKTELGGEEEGN